MVVACKDLVYPTHNNLCLFSSHHPDFHVHILTFLNKLLTARFPPHLEPSVLCPRTDVCESKEVKCFRLILAPLLAVLFCKASELDEPAFIFCKA